VSNERFQVIDQLFRAALALPIAARSAFLKQQCGDDEEMYREVEALLTEDGATRGALDRPAFGEHIDVTTVLSARPMSEGPGTHIGPYKILQQIGEGGFGTVFMAEQSTPVHRRVAVKIIKLGMDTKQVIARFEAERQALAIMDHPNIAKVFDAGATEAGRPYFVMELCTGSPITEYCDDNKLSVEERLELFAQVCRAVQHAHQKGIIHRDIKPSNVLVFTQDGQPFAKVIDFGVAKATNMRLTDRTMFTEHRQLLGTMEYMSPEQAEGALDIDTRTDVYSLGVLLYELLTGSTPVDRKSLREAAIFDVQRIIREVDPPHPSTRLSRSAATIGTIAAMRQTEPKKLGAIVRGELDWIVMKALDKDRRRRYETANELAADVGSYLAGQPVNAAPPSTAYRARKFVLRNKGLATAASIVAAALILGVIGTSAGMAWALEERDRADREAASALAAQREEQARAEELEQVAAFQASQLADIDTRVLGTNLRTGVIDKRRAFLESGGLDEEQIAAALAELESALAGVNFTNVALETLDANIFERALTAIDAQFADQPLIRARLLQTVASTLIELGLLERATTPQRIALDIRRSTLGDEHPHTLESLSNLATLMGMLGRFGIAEPLIREALDTYRRVHGDEHPNTLTALGNLGLVLRRQDKLDEAEPYLREALETFRRVRGAEHPQTIAGVGFLGGLLRDQGKLEDAEPYFREAMNLSRRVLGKEHPGTLDATIHMGLILRDQGKYDEAEAHFRQALDGLRRVVGDAHPLTLRAIGNMGILHQQVGRLDEAEPFFREALETRRRTLGDEHPATMTSINNFGALLERMERLEEAEIYIREAMEIRRRVLGDPHIDTLVSIVDLGAVLRRIGRLEEADHYGAEAVRTALRYLPADHWRLGTALGQHATTLTAMKRYAEAEPRFLEAAAILESALGAQHGRIVTNITAVADLYERWHEAEPDAGHDIQAAAWRQRLP